MNKIPPKRIVTYVAMTASSSTEILATTKTLPTASSSLTLVATPGVASAAIGAAKTTTRLEASTTMVESTTPRIKILPLVTVHRSSRMPPLNDRRPSFDPSPSEP
jgi:hypothetical protein